MLSCDMISPIQGEKVAKTAGNYKCAGTDKLFQRADWISRKSARVCRTTPPPSPPPKSTCRLKQCNMEGERTDSVDPNSTEKRDGKKKRKKGKRGGVRTPPLSGSLLPVVMVIRGFGQDYEIFYLVTSALLERTSKPARSVSVSLTPPDSRGKLGQCLWPTRLRHANILYFKQITCVCVTDATTQKCKCGIYLYFFRVIWASALHQEARFLFCIMERVALIIDPSLRKLVHFLWLPRCNLRAMKTHFLNQPVYMSDVILPECEPLCRGFL